MNRRGLLRAFSVASATGLLMPAQAERLLYELNQPVSVSGSGIPVWPGMKELFVAEYNEYERNVVATSHDGRWWDNS